MDRSKLAVEEPVANTSRVDTGEKWSRPTFLRIAVSSAELGFNLVVDNIQTDS